MHRLRLPTIALLAAALTATVAGCDGDGSDSANGAPPPPPAKISGAARVGIADSLTTVRFDRPAPKGLSGEASLTAAGNEFESFQVVVEARRELRGVSVSAGEPLRGPEGATIENDAMTFYREVPYRVGTAGKPPSDAEGGAGLWPDALIPAVDYLYGERRNAFPVDLAAGEKLVAWVDLLVPAEQPSGTYRGSVVVSDSSGRVAELPLSVRALDFEIPSTATLRSGYFADPFHECSAFTGSPHCDIDDPATWERRALFVRAGLENRISISNGFSAPVGPTAQSLFDRFAVPLISGTGSGTRLPGARLTELDASTFCANTDGCLETWRELAGRHDFESRFFVYLCDEPSYDSSAWAECAATAARSEAAWPGVRKLVTSSIAAAEEAGGGEEGALAYTDLMVSPIQRIIGGGESQRPSYDDYLAASDDGSAPNELWLYTSCLSFSCNSELGSDPAFAGWPGYAIDQPASQSRAMGWLSFFYGASGELYYETAVSLDDAWRNQYVEGGNGDGNLFYPGLPQGGEGVPAIGGTHEIPIESIRLKRIRDGREDYEYLRRLENNGSGEEARSVVEGLFGPPGSAARTTVGPAAMEAARIELAEMLSG